MNRLRRFWDLVRNAPLEFVDHETGEVDEIWQTTRWDRWHITRSHQWLYAFTRLHDCGCRTRLRYKTLICFDCYEAAPDPSPERL